MKKLLLILALVAGLTADMKYETKYECRVYEQNKAIPFNLYIARGGQFLILADAVFTWNNKKDRYIMDDEDKKIYNELIVHTDETLTVLAGGFKHTKFYCKEI